MQPTPHRHGGGFGVASFFASRGSHALLQPGIARPPQRPGVARPPQRPGGLLHAELPPAPSLLPAALQVRGAGRLLRGPAGGAGGAVRPRVAPALHGLRQAAPPSDSAGRERDGQGKVGLVDTRWPLTRCVAP